ncbi:YdeI/OmpD-associated family protein [Sinomonas halotolerans]|uniref:YdeI/OmpD-associated family protein n=1 Tax=Sinomonas halotolerans TaxID=1644133 RepID=A0ABU9X014_9MICC
MAPELPELLVPDASAWREWLAEHHAQSRGVWLVLHKKGGDVTALAYPDAVEEALCFGWIDGQLRTRDAGSSAIRFTPRTRTSRWSQANVARVERLEAEGRMTPAGRAVVDAAKADGRWEMAYGGAATAEVPDDLAAAIAAVPEAQAMFDVLTSTNRFAIVYRITSVKRPETRIRKIAEFVDMLARHETVYPQKRKL